MSAQVPVYRVVLEHDHVERMQPQQPVFAAASAGTADSPRGVLLRRFYMSSAIAAAVIVFLFGINMATDRSDLWFQWPTLIILLVWALRSISTFRTPYVPAPQALTQDALKEERMHRFYVSSASAGTLIIFLFGINMFAGGPFWFHWPALGILFVFAIRLFFLFRKPIV